MNDPKTIKLTPAVSNKPCDIEYRLKRAFALASECRQFLEGIDENTPVGTLLMEARQHARDAQDLVSQMRSAAPAKRIHGKKAKAAAGIVEEPKAPKAKRGARVVKAPKAKSKAAPEKLETLDSMLTTLDAELNDDLEAAAE